MIYLSFIPWIIYILINIKYSKKKYDIVNYKLILAFIAYLYFTRLKRSVVLIPMFLVLGIFLLIDTYYKIPKSKERIRNYYSKYMYFVPLVPAVSYILFGKYKVIYLSYFIISFIVDVILYYLNNKKKK